MKRYNVRKNGQMVETANGAYYLVEDVDKLLTDQAADLMLARLKIKNLERKLREETEI